MVRREAIRFFRSHRLLAFCGAAILACGLGASTLALTFLLTSASLSYPGIRGASTAVIAEEVNGGGSTPISYERFERLRATSSHPGHLVVYTRALPTLPGSPAMAAVSAGFFSVFTSGLTAGRDFTPLEEGKSESHVAILSYRYAESRFGSPASAIGQNLVMKGRPFQIVGVAPRSFEGMFGDITELWVPASAVIPLAMEGPSGNSWKVLNVFYAIAAGEGRTSKQLAQDLSASLPATIGDEPRLHASPGLTEDPVRDRNLSARLRLGLALAIAFTLVSGLNLAWLLLAQSPLRAAETSLKKALGADTSRLICESAMGPAAVIVLGFAGAGILLGSGLIAIGRMTGIAGQAARGAWHTALLAYGTEVPFGAVLLCLVVVLPLIGVLRDAGSGRRDYCGPLMNVPVILQVSLVVATCILAGMVTSALISEMNDSLGYDPAQLTVVNIAPASGTLAMSWSGLGVSPTMRALARLIGQAESIPGVRAAAYSSSPAEAIDDGTPCWLERADSGGSPRVTVQDISVSPGYMRTVGGEFLEGRDFPPLAGAGEVILNQAAAQALWPNQNPVNRPVRIMMPTWSGLPAHSSSAIVAGVVADLRQPGYARHAAPVMYTSMYKNGLMDFNPKLILNGIVPWSAVESTLGKQVQIQLPGMKIVSVYAVRDRVRDAFAKDAIGTYLAIGAALAMAAVSSIGLYASLAYFVRSRRRELAIRVCLGASSSSIRRIVHTRALFSAGLGVLLSMTVWPLLARRSSVEYLGAVSWSLGRAAAICLACLAVSAAIAHVAAREAAWLSPAQLLKEE